MDGATDTQREWRKGATTYEDRLDVSYGNNVS